ncbi:MAG TPA: sigma-70 family RNA polymerase sigma factor [Saprospiraceae bacterium]|nr:sigma-70 family RNA polymerase sigma factor [Saprospiraceae bacterium]HNT22319.1 sigma-70 family RNA polymerase sigma factor [Saprospiraceae bacterium]
MDHQELIPHLFRTEFRKITAVLCNAFGMDHIEAAEDIAADTFLAALQTWPYRGIPDHPSAWLYATAKNKAFNYIQRNKLYSTKILPAQIRNADHRFLPDIDLSDQNIRDSQLQMLFALCKPSLPVEAQIALSLRILCGLGIDEIARAFLTSKETIHKRLYRAKEKLCAEKEALRFPPEHEINERLGSVLATLYLLFSEGYYSEIHDSVMREELCLEAMRLVSLLTEDRHTDRPAVHALLALMCFHASRFKARKGASGEMVLYEDQDETLWDQALISRGVECLHKASRGEVVSKYHLEAAIAYWHTVKKESREKWEHILNLYDRLLQLEASPIAALNRVFALSKIKGKEAAIKEAEKLKLLENPYYHTLLGKLYTGLDDGIAEKHFLEALSRVRTRADQNILQRHLSGLKPGFRPGLDFSP